jgi:L-lactate dehydrogenase complex protein LldE
MTKAQLFITCLGDQFYTSTLQNMTHLLERLGVELTFPPEQTCCGQPLFNVTTSTSSNCPPRNVAV